MTHPHPEFRDQTFAPHFSAGRIMAILLRHWYLLRGSWPRFFELAYWPTIQMILWGFLSAFFTEQSSWLSQGVGVLIAAILLWDVLFRSQLGVSLSFLEEMWSRNLGHLFVSPLRFHEWMLGLMLVSLMRTLIGAVPAAILAIVFWQYSVFDLGLPLLVFFFNLSIFGWSIGLMIIGLILRFGMGAESLAWAVIFLLAPLSCVYYPVETLPDWLLPIALSLPTTHVFEGMRSVLFHGIVRYDVMALTIGLNAVYLVLGTLFLLAQLNHARITGALFKQGE